MSKLWIFGDSFWCRNTYTPFGEMELNIASNTPVDHFCEVFAQQNNLDFSWGSNAMGHRGGSNDVTMYYFDWLTQQPQFDIDRDLCIVGLTTFDRRAVKPNMEGVDWQFHKGIENIRHHRLLFSNHDTMLTINQQGMNKYQANTWFEIRHWNHENLKIESDHMLYNTDLSWEEYKSCNMIDGMISHAVARGVNVILHRGCSSIWANQAHPATNVDYVWNNMSDAPSFGRFVNKQDMAYYQNHMSGADNVKYGNLLSEWYQR